jgi:ethanolamine utilization protein EutN
MKIGQVIGSIVSTIQHPAYDGKKILLCDIYDVNGDPLANTQEIAIDRIDAGVGDWVLIMSEGNGIRQLWGADTGPVRDVIVGIIDDITAFSGFESVSQGVEE